MSPQLPVSECALLSVHGPKTNYKSKAGRIEAWIAEIIFFLFNIDTMTS